MQLKPLDGEDVGGVYRPSFFSSEIMFGQDTAESIITDSEGVRNNQTKLDLIEMTTASNYENKAITTATNSQFSNFVELTGVRS